MITFFLIALVIVSMLVAIALSFAIAALVIACCEVIGGNSFINTLRECWEYC